MKILYPLIEIAVAFIVLIYIPNKIFNVIKLVLNVNADRSQIFIFIKENIFGFAAGLFIAVGFIQLTGSSLEEVVVGSVRNVIQQAQRIIGWDEITICKENVKRIYGWNADTYAEEVSRFNILEYDTMNERHLILSEGQKSLLFHRDYADRKGLYDKSIHRFCEAKIEKR